MPLCATPQTPPIAVPTIPSSIAIATPPRRGGLTGVRIKGLRGNKVGAKVQGIRHQPHGGVVGIVGNEGLVRQGQGGAGGGGGGGNVINRVGGNGVGNNVSVVSS
ncbi:hypothetical protein GYH30_006394 [Glycine max]|nr:hypothetical protein GYH30_006394 [Glycine max]